MERIIDDAYRLQSFLNLHFISIDVDTLNHQFLVLIMYLSF